MKLSCIESTCIGRLHRGRERYIMCSTPDLVDDMIENASTYCDPPEKRMNEVDIIEIMSPKERLRQSSRSNQEDILDIEII